VVLRLASVVVTAAVLFTGPVSPAAGADAAKILADVELLRGLAMALSESPCVPIEDPIGFAVCR
jgi:hypothetical protein